MDMPVKWKSLQKVFMEAEMHSVIMLDELHRLPKREQENLLPVLNEGTIQMDNGKRLRLPSRISIFAATTEIQDIIKPLRDRFHFIARFEDYSDEDMAQIVARMAVKVDLSPSEDECMIFGRASASTPRQARNIILTARDLGSTDPDEVLEMVGITRDGLTEDHIEYLLALNQIGGRAGVENLSNMTGQPKDVLVDLEKLLINKGFIIYGAKGRELVMEGMRLVNSLRDK
jgi:Holliday junction DNA helicase RuvB